MDARFFHALNVEVENFNITKDLIKQAETDGQIIVLSRKFYITSHFYIAFLFCMCY